MRLGLYDSSCFSQPHGLLPPLITSVVTPSFHKTAGKEILRLGLYVSLFFIPQPHGFFHHCSPPWSHLLSIRQWAKKFCDRVCMILPFYSAAAHFPPSKISPGTHTFSPQDNKKICIAEIMRFPIHTFPKHPAFSMQAGAPMTGEFMGCPHAWCLTGPMPSPLALCIQKNSGEPNIRRCPSYSRKSAENGFYSRLYIRLPSP